jgi:hypothetical protein
MQHLLTHDRRRIPWNKGKITGQKSPWLAEDSETWNGIEGRENVSEARVVNRSFGTPLHTASMGIPAMGTLP